MGFSVMNIYKIIASLMLCFMLTACGESVLLSALPEEEANEVIAVLNRSGIKSGKVSSRNGVDVMVSPDDLANATDVLNRAGLPRAQSPGLADLFKKEGMISSPGEERVRYMYGLSEELSRTLRRIDGVISARVHVVLPGNDPLGKQGPPSAASVLVRHAPESDITALVPKIRDLVAHSVEGLAADRVSVVLVAAASSDSGTAQSGGGGASSLTIALGIALLLSVALNVIALLFPNKLPKLKA